MENFDFSINASNRKDIYETIIIIKKLKSDLTP